MKNLFFILILVFMLTGCTQINEIQYQSYAVGIGIDYINNQYQVILQFLDFSNVAKSPQGSSNQKSSVWLAEAKGSSIEDAFTKIYKGIQIPINYDQLNVFLFGRHLIENRLEQTLQALDTNYNIRVTGWVYGTEMDQKDIFTTKVPFNYAFISSKINEPDYMQRQNSTIPPITLQELLYQFNERTKTILLPNVSIRKSIVRQNATKVPVATFEGAFLIKDKKMKGLLTEKDLKGFIRVNDKVIRSLVTFREKNNKEETTVVELQKPKLKRSFFKRDNRLTPRLDVKLSAIIRESSHNINDKSVKSKIEKVIKNEIYSSYFRSNKVGADIFQFEDYIYRYRYSDWERLSKTKELPILRKQDIHIKVKPLKSINKMNSSFNPYFDEH